MTTESDIEIKDEPFCEEDAKTDEGSVFYFKESQPYLNLKSEALSQDDIKEEQIEDIEFQQEKYLHNEDQNTKGRSNMSFLRVLIEEVKKYPCLWNKSLDIYNNQNVRNNSWKLISEALNTPSIDVRRKWSSLRDCFRRELAQQKKTPDRLCTKMRRKYVYFNELLFLLPYVKVATPKSVLPERRISEEPETPSVPEGGNEHSSLEESPDPSTAYSRARKKPLQDYGEEILNLLKEASKNRFDKDESFLLSLAPKFKLYDSQKRCLLRLEILNTILRFHQQHMPAT